jgi:hypothetical protein
MCAFLVLADPHDEWPKPFQAVEGLGTTVAESSSMREVFWRTHRYF